MTSETYESDSMFITKTDVFGIPGYYIEDINGDGIKELLLGKSFQTDDPENDNTRMIYTDFPSLPYSWVRRDFSTLQL